MIVNRQRRLRVPVSSLERFLERVRQITNMPADSLTVCFVTDAQIARWNRIYRRKRGPTDVLSFPARETSGPAERGYRRVRERRRKHVTHHFGGNNSASPASYFGDIAIAPAVARRNARSFGRTFEDEMRLLILHGALHLIGYDHEKDHGEMNRMEAHLRRRLGLT
jgi:probable rRNA maturation factor